tara:strand:- start:1296 stop:1472 length:177 start_codon:yes stop_codon:yes gene_type:complete
LHLPLSFGASTNVWANPTNTATEVGTRTATAGSNQSGVGIAANEFSTASILIELDIKY